MLSGIRAAIEAFWRMIDLIMALLLAALIVLVFTNVVMRYGFSSGLRVTIELSRLWFVWVVMLGAAVMLRRGEHLQLSEFSEAVMPRFVPILRRICWAVVLVAVLMLFVGAWRQTLANWNNISQLTGLPSGLMYLAGVVSGAMMAAIALVRILGPDPGHSIERVEEH